MIDTPAVQMDGYDGPWNDRYDAVLTRLANLTRFRQDQGRRCYLHYTKSWGSCYGKLGLSFEDTHNEEDFAAGWRCAWPETMPVFATVGEARAWLYEKTCTLDIIAPAR